MIRRIHELQVLTKFTHYDLHLRNIITNDDLLSFKIIDFGYSHVPNVTGWIEANHGVITIGGISSVFDPWFDIVRLIMIYYLLSHQRVDPDIAGILEANKFSTWLEKRGPIPGYIMLESQEYIGSELVQNIDVVDMIDYKIYDPSIWVGHGDLVNCDELDEFNVDEYNSYRDLSSEEQLGIKVKFGELLTCLKRYSMGKRKHKDVSILIDKFDQLIQGLREDLEEELYSF